MDINDLLHAGATPRNLQDKTGVSSSNLESPTTSQVLEDFSLREVLILLGGGEWRKRLENRIKPNGRLFADYLSIIRASKSYKWFKETEKASEPVP